MRGLLLLCAAGPDPSGPMILESRWGAPKLTTVLIVILSIIFLLWVVRFVDCLKLRHQDPFLTADPAAAVPSPAPFVSVLVPARNESVNIRRTLGALLSQNYPAFEVIVADDRSEDDTPRILREFADRDPRVRLLEFHDLPAGWTGKNHVLWESARHARGEILLFLDADTTLDPGALSVLASYFIENRLDMLSPLIRSEHGFFWEQVLGPIAVTALMLRFPLQKVNDPKSPVAFAAGQALMIRADVYHAVGGHRSIRSFLLEDMALARLVKNRGYRLRLVYGFNLAVTQMFSSLGRFYTGWTRIFYCALQGNVLRLFAGALFLVIFSLMPYATLAFAGLRLALGSGDSRTVLLLVMSLVQIAVMMSLMAWLIRMGRGTTRYIVLHLPACLIVTAIFFSAIAVHFSKSITWKGMAYDVHAEKLDLLPDVPEPPQREKPEAR